MRCARAWPLHLAKGSAPRSQTNQYSELKRLIKQNGLLDRQTAYFAGKISLTLGLLAVSLTLDTCPRTYTRSDSEGPHPVHRSTHHRETEPPPRTPRSRPRGCHVGRLPRLGEG